MLTQDQQGKNQNSPASISSNQNQNMNPIFNGFYSKLKTDQKRAGGWML